jgi:hypothetical protein
VVRTIWREWLHSAAFRPVLKARKRMSRLVRLAEGSSLAPNALFVRHAGGRRRSTRPKRLFIDSDEAEIPCGETGTVTPIAVRACRVSEAVTIEYAAVVNSSRRRLRTSGAKVTEILSIGLERRGAVDLLRSRPHCSSPSRKHAASGRAIARLYNDLDGLGYSAHRAGGGSVRRRIGSSGALVGNHSCCCPRPGICPCR